VAEKDLVIVHGRFSGFASRELDCSGHRSHQGRNSSRALGCDPGRGPHKNNPRVATMFGDKFATIARGR